MSTEFDPTHYRRALGAFATGVTIVTARGPDGVPVGLTANSFNSLSLDPPMVLWALAKNALSLSAFESAEYFAVHVLAASQRPLSQRFATRGAEKFAGLEWGAGFGGAPLLDGCTARFQCRTTYKYEGGDHVIFVGEVLAFDHSDLPALAFHRGAYGRVVSASASSALGGPAGSLASDGSLSSYFLGTLLAVARTHLLTRVKSELGELDLDDGHYQLLLLLKGKGAASLSELDARARSTGERVSYQTLVELSLRGLLDVGGPDDPSTRARLTAEGDAVAVRLGAALKAAEADVERVLGASDAQALKMLLAGLGTDR